MPEKKVKRYRQKGVREKGEKNKQEAEIKIERKNEERCKLPVREAERDTGRKKESKK